MNKGSALHPLDRQGSEERRVFVAESLTSFSKHLMLLLAAVIAFAAAPVLHDAPQYLQFCFAFGVILGISSFIAGHEGITVILSAYIQKDPNNDFVSLEDSLSKGALQKCRARIEIQYWLMLGSLIIIAACIVASVFTGNKAHISCIATANSSTDTSKNLPAAQNNRDTNLGSTDGKNDPTPTVSQPKQVQSQSNRK